MARIIDVDARPLMASLVLRVSFGRQLRWRLAIAAWLIRIAAAIAGTLVSIDIADADAGSSAD